MADEIIINVEPDPISEASIKVNYPGNTHRARDKRRPEKEEKIVEQVTSGKVVQRKKPIGRKIADTFAGDNLRNVGEYVLFDILIPAAKSMVVDAMSKGTERAFFGDTRRSSGNRPGYTSYNRMSSPSRVEPRQISYRARASHEFNEIVLEDRGEAEFVLDRLGDLVEEYGMATVNELYDLVGITGSFTDDKWGWTDLRTAHVSNVRGGYLLNLPKTIPIL